MLAEGGIAIGELCVLICSAGEVVIKSYPNGNFIGRILVKSLFNYTLDAHSRFTPFIVNVLYRQCPL